MTRILKVALGLYASAALMIFAAGVTYLFRSEFMPFHSLAVGQSWQALPPGVQALVLTLMKAVGAAYVAISFSFLALLAVPFRQGAGWSNLLLLLLGLLVAIGSFNAMAFLAAATRTSQPVLGPIAVGALCVAAFLLARLSHHGQPPNPSVKGTSRKRAAPYVER